MPPRPRTLCLPAHLLTACVTALTLSAIAQQPTEAAAAEPARDKPIQVFVLMGQSNMVGFGRIALADQQGTLEYLSKQQGKYPHLL